MLTSSQMLVEHFTLQMDNGPVKVTQEHLKVNEVNALKGLSQSSDLN